MEQLKKDSNTVTVEELIKIVEILKQGGVVVLPTDTIYGFSALAKDKEAVEKIYALKKRVRRKPLVVLMKSFCMLRQYCFLSTKQYVYLKRKMDKGEAITVILRSKGEALRHLVNQRGDLAVRIPYQSAFLIKLLKKINQPIVSTSLNLSGQEEIDNLENIEACFDGKKIDFVLDSGVLRRKKASKIEDITDIKAIKIIRS